MVMLGFLIVAYLVCDNAGRIKEKAWYEKEEFVQQEYRSLSEWTVPKMYDVGVTYLLHHK